MASLVANRMFFNFVKEWRVGVSSGSYSYVGEPSGLGPLEFVPYPDLLTAVPIPGGNPILHQVGLTKPHGSLFVHDYNAVTQLLRTIDVVSGGGTEVAVPSVTARNTIGYFVVVVYNDTIVNATDGRTIGTSSFSFSNTLIGEIKHAFREPTSPTWVTFYFDSVTQTDA